MTKNTILYWAATGLVALAFGFGGVMDIARPPNLVETMNHLGYPVYLMTILGIWKVLGAAAVLAPGLPRIKEWAYAGMIFDLTGASLSHASVGDGLVAVATPLIIAVITLASWYLRPESRKLSGSRSGAAATSPAYSELAAR